LSVKDIIFSVDRSDLALAEGDAPAKVADPTVWVPAFADALRAAYGDPRHRLHERTHAAARIATTRMQIIVGSSTPDDFHNVVFEPNRPTTEGLRWATPWSRRPLPPCGRCCATLASMA
jgi:hypothetical protein